MFETAKVGDKTLIMQYADTKPGSKNMLNPNMELICLWCGNHHKPYNHMVMHDYAHMNFCNDTCMIRYMKYGKIRNFFEAIPRYLWHRPRLRFLDWLYRKDCPVCKEPMFRILHNEIYSCWECGVNVERHGKVWTLEAM